LKTPVVGVILSLGWQDEVLWKSFDFFTADDQGAQVIFVHISAHLAEISGEP